MPESDHELELLSYRFVTTICGWSGGGLTTELMMTFGKVNSRPPATTDHELRSPSKASWLRCDVPALGCGHLGQSRSERAQGGPARRPAVVYFRGSWGSSWAAAPMVASQTEVMSTFFISISP
jgi:hypothetical protein